MPKGQSLSTVRIHDKGTFAKTSNPRLVLSIYRLQDFKWSDLDFQLVGSVLTTGQSEMAHACIQDLLEQE
jgi:hypothetical protein